MTRQKSKMPRSSTNTSNTHPLPHAVIILRKSFSLLVGGRCFVCGYDMERHHGGYGGEVDDCVLAGGEWRTLPGLPYRGHAKRVMCLSSPEPAAHGKLVLAHTTSSSASLEELRDGQCSCHHGRTFVSFPQASGSWQNVRGQLETTFARVLRRSTAYLERTQQALVDAHHGSSVVELATVIRGAEQRD